MSILDSALPKWPEMRVIGNKVSKKQAADIIMRTDFSFFYPSTNDEEWLRIFYDIIGVGQVEDDDIYKAIYSVAKRIGWLEGIEYIRPSRIMSNYIRGPRGWIDWDGNIDYGTHNIGKWPSCEDVFKDWEIVANAFPYLNLRCQLFDKEGCEDGEEAVIEYIVREGKVEAVKPVDIIPRGIELEYDICAANAERGVSREYLEKVFCRLSGKKMVQNSEEELIFCD